MEQQYSGTASEAWKQLSTDELLEHILTSAVAPHEKARSVLTAREAQTTARHNRLLLALTIVVAIAGACEGLQALHSLLSRPTSGTSINLFYRH